MFSCNLHADDSACEKLPEDWLVTSDLNISAIEEESLYEMKMHKARGIPQLPFGRINNKWVALKALLNDENKLVKFKSQPITWKSLAGREGYAVLQNGCVIGAMITGMN